MAPLVVCGRRGSAGHREREGHQQTCLAQPESVGYQVCDFPLRVSPSLTVASAAGSFPGPSFVPGAYLCGGILHIRPTPQLFVQRLCPKGRDVELSQAHSQLWCPVSPADELFRPCIAEHCMHGNKIINT